MGTARLPRAREMSRLLIMVVSLAMTCSLAIVTAMPTSAASPPVTISSIAPVTGPTTGGTVVMITGGGFAAGATVTIGGTPATAVTFVSARTITATTPAHAVGVVSIVVTNVDTGTATLANAFTYTAAQPLTLSSISPASGSTAGGTNVTIMGTAFIANAKVTIGGVAATNVVVASATSITATTPAHAAGAASVVVTLPAPDNRTATLATNYTYTAALAVTGVAPNSGPTSGGTSITITGTGFVTGTTVTVGGNVCTIPIVASATTMSCVTPAGAAGAAHVVVTVPGGQSATLASGFTYTGGGASGPVTVSSVSPNSGPTSGGTAVTVTGTGFATGATVTIGGHACLTPAVTDVTTIDCITPAGVAGAANIVVTVPGGQSATLPGGFTYTVPLTITAISPNSGPVGGGTNVTISGTGFTSGSSVTIAGLSCANTTVFNSGRIICTTPAIAIGVGGDADVIVTASSGQSATLPGGFTYTTTGSSALTIAGISPNSGPTAGGTNVTITGTGFTSGVSVTIAGLGCTNTTVFNGTKIVCTTPAIAIGVGGATDVIVTGTNGQSATLPGGFNYITPPAPTITSVSPAVGPIAGGTSVVISGSGFQVGATVTIGGSDCSGVSVFNAGRTASCVTSAGTAGAANVVVTNPDSSVITLSRGFTYSATTTPTVTAISPTSGPVSGGTNVTITGTGFVSGATVTIGGAAATNVVVDGTGTSITATTPAGTAGAVDVVVTNAGGQGATLTGGFTYGSTGSAALSISPSSGPSAGGTQVTITGNGFVSGATVTIGGSACTNPVVANATTITCATPAGTGSADVAVTNPNQPAITLPGGFTYADAPPPTTTQPTTPSASNPAFAPVAPITDSADHRYFPETHHTLNTGFKVFWDAHGGVAIFGLPISEEFQELSKTDNKTYTVQYFERIRFEYHPEFMGTPYEVELGLLGEQMTDGRSGEAPFQPIAESTITGKQLFIPATKHSLSGTFRTMWEAHDGLTLLGYPISEQFEEKNADDGKTYTVQYFERARIELHPEFAGTPNESLLGLLGVQAAIQRGYLPPR
jgi:hypothetical protein